MMDGLRQQREEWKEWQGSVTIRAKKIHPEEWESHKEELRDLYQEMTVKGLMDFMKTRHGFTPSYVIASS